MDSQLARIEDSLRAAMPLAKESGRLDAKVNEALARAQQGTRILLRSVLAFSATAAVALALLIAPSVKAIASVRRMTGALDEVSAVRITDYAVRRDGARVAVRSTSYSQGMWRLDEPGLDQATIYAHGKCYTYEGSTKTYILEEKPRGWFARGIGSLKLSSLVVDAGLGTIQKKIEIEQGVSLNGRTYNRAIIENAAFFERLIIYADPKTDLPMLVQAEGLERNQWVLRQESLLDYSPRFSAATFRVDSKQAKILSRSQWLDDVAARIESKSLGSIALNRGRLILRDILVDSDGTIFIAYQAQDRTPHRWTGYALSVADSNSTIYARTEIMGDSTEDLIPRLKDGKLEVEALVPIEPLSRLDGSFQLTAQVDRKNKLVRLIHAVTTTPEGVKKYEIVPNFWSSKKEDMRTTSWTLAEFRKTAYRSSSLMSLLPLTDVTLFGNGVAKEMYKARVRARYYMEIGDAVNARRWLNENLRLIEEHERQGYGPWSKRDVFEKLEQLDGIPPASDQGPRLEKSR